MSRPSCRRTWPIGARHHGRVLAAEIGAIARKYDLGGTSSPDGWQIADLSVSELVRQVEAQADAASRADLDQLLAERDDAARRAAEGQA